MVIGVLWGDGALITKIWAGNKGFFYRVIHFFLTILKKVMLVTCNWISLFRYGYDCVTKGVACLMLRKPAEISEYPIQKM